VSSKKKYFYSSKDLTLSQIQTALERLETFFAQEVETAANNERCEIESENTMSFPPNIVAIYSAIKALKKVCNSIENNEYDSLNVEQS
jgi:hypothetical protein